MAQLKSLQRRLTSTVVLGAEVREREVRVAMMEEEKVRLLAEEKRSGIKSWWRRMVCRQTLLVEVAFAGREVVDNRQAEAEARFRWRKKVVPPGGGQRLEKVMEEVRRSTRDSFEEEVAEGQAHAVLLVEFVSVNMQFVIVNICERQNDNLRDRMTV